GLAHAVILPGGHLPRFVQQSLNEAKYTTSDLNKFYSAFFWRNALSSRYDQGFLTKLSDDLKRIHEVLVNLNKYSGSTIWSEKAHSALDEIFSNTHPVRSAEQIKATLLEDDIRGAQKQAINLYLHSQTKFDLVTGNKLDRFSEDREKKVDMHHIFPKAWCKDNSSSFPGLDKYTNSIANLVPLSAKSNGEHWKSKSPKTAIENLGITWDACADYFELAIINEDLFKKLNEPSPDPIDFFQRRAELIANQLMKLQCL
ncbi:hypothetical protein, partial [Vogesella alkaliphila]|uniref:hypothetical protein n=1 Tax=Vogesella alkaliphila TaxID=1193621 RepID=UPI001E57A27B